MKIAYFDCASGISGDMMLGALVDAGVPLDAIQTGIDSLGLPDCQLRSSEVKKKGFRATQIVVEHPPEHKHRHLSHIVEMIDGSVISDRQKDLAKQIFGKLAAAEAKVHGTTVEKVHFHEVGAVDSIADIVGTAIGWDLLGAERAAASAVPTGTGFVQIAHGRCALPAPATGELLAAAGIPLAASSVTSELTTPTGAAILATLVRDYGPLPAMTIEQIGYGAGQRDLDEQANLLRLVVGETADAHDHEQVWVMETNLDDVSGEMIGHCVNKLWAAGALDVSITAIQMKKNRPGVTLSLLCQAKDLERLERILFGETTTLGIRRWAVERTKLKRRQVRVESRWGEIEGIVAETADGRLRFSPEFDSCQRTAEQHKLPLTEVYDEARRAFLASTEAPEKQNK